MDQRLMGPPLQAEDEEVGGVMRMGGRDEQMQVLLRHCWDMKRQETRLRLVTLLLLLTCTSLYLFTFCIDLRRRQSSQPAEFRDSGEQSAQYLSQQKGALPHIIHSIQLSSKPGSTDNGSQLMMWQNPERSGVFEYNETRGAIVIPASGVYFLYVTFQLACHNVAKDTSFRKLWVEVVSLNEGYGNDDHLTLMNAQDGVTCHASRNVLAAERVELSEGEHVSVLIKLGYNLISTSKFGAYFISPSSLLQ